MRRFRDPTRLVSRLRARPVPAPAAASAEPAPQLQADEVPDWLRQDALDNLNMRRVVSFVLGPDDSAIDIGCNHGGLLGEIVRVAPDGRHIAFEPIPELAAELRQRFPHVTIHEAAASNRSGKTTFAHVRAADGWSGLKFRPLPTGQDGDVVEIEVVLERLDDVIDPELRPALVKIDVEGAEQQVIEGALETLRRHVPTLLFEHGLGSANVFGTEPDDIYRLLVEEVGYRIFDLDGTGPYTLDEFKHSYHAAERVNYLAHR